MDEILKSYQTAKSYRLKHFSDIYRKIKAELDRRSFQTIPSDKLFMMLNKCSEALDKLSDDESEDKRDNLPSESTWKIRKQETLDHLKDKATKEEKMITLGDKLSNIQAMYRDYLEIGDELWDRFNQKDKSEHAWYYKSIAELLSDLSDTSAYQEYVELVNKVFGE